MPRFSFVPTYNAPAVLTLALAAVFVHGIDRLMGGVVAPSFFAVPGTFDFSQPGNYFRIFSHVLGHKDFAHLAANLSILLLIGPILEEKYGTRPLAWMMVTVALATGVLNVLFFETGLMGASGIVFMMVVLGSFANHKPGQIPLTFLLVAGLFLIQELGTALDEDGISHFAHLLGGGIGSLFGFRSAGARRLREGR
jgi:membrane associated rhomboid family serine protease